MKLINIRDNNLVAKVQMLGLNRSDMSDVTTGELSVSSVFVEYDVVDINFAFGTVVLQNADGLYEFRLKEVDFYLKESGLR